MGISAHENPVRRVVDRIERLDPDWIDAMHGGSRPRDAIPHYVHALPKQPFAYQGKVLGRELPTRPCSATRDRLTTRVED
jgi:hypothetical protein